MIVFIKDIFNTISDDGIEFDRIGHFLRFGCDEFNNRFIIQFINDIN